MRGCALITCNLAWLSEWRRSQRGLGRVVVMQVVREAIVCWIINRLLGKLEPNNRQFGMNDRLTDASILSALGRLPEEFRSVVLLADVDATLKFVSADTKLELKRPVKGVFISRDAVARELVKKFDEDEGAKRMQRSELVLKKFGLLDRDFHLRPFMLSLANF